MKAYFLFFALSLSFLLYGQQKQLCITVDDLPTITYGIDSSNFELSIHEKLLATFDKYDIPAIGYVNEGRLYQDGNLDSSKVKLLKMWLDKGYDLGNHTYSHIDYNKVSDKEYFEEILMGEQQLLPLIAAHGKKPFYFRHPYLHTGSDSIQWYKLHHFLNMQGYTAAPVTIDNADYLFAKAYHIAYRSSDTTLMKKIGNSYVSYMEKKLVYFEQKSLEIFGNQITQTLLIHSNLLNAHYLDDLAKMYIKHGYQFVSQSEALLDEHYQTPISYYTPRGISWLFRWAMSLGFDESIMDNDVDTPKWVEQMAND